MYRYVCIWAENDQINNFLSYYGHCWWVESITIIFKLHNSHLLGQNIWKMPRVPPKPILSSHPWVLLLHQGEAHSGTELAGGLENPHLGDFCLRVSFECLYRKGPRISTLIEWKIPFTLVAIRRTHLSDISMGITIALSFLQWTQSLMNLVTTLPACVTMAPWNPDLSFCKVRTLLRWASAGSVALLSTCAWRIISWTKSTSLLLTIGKRKQVPHDI